ncbi:MAG: 4Fe-4S dicluster domain-containing protein [Nanoarchaeota archaeon]|nr:4Fe-4S dicluster domain-containing protein [Nanoarchaeota archaeon]
MASNEFNKKRSKIQLVSSSFFILLLLAGLFYPLLGYFAIVCMVSGIVIAIFKGRKWCDFCPRGSFWDYFVKPFSRNKKIPAVFSKWHTRFFVMMLLMTMFTIQIVKRWPNPYSIGSFFIIFLIITTIVGLLLGLFIQQRTWCRFCPVGSMGNAVGRNKYQLKIDSKKCTDCGICAKVCPMQLNPSSHKKKSIEIVNEPDCIKCKLCVNSCPRKALKF